MQAVAPAIAAPTWFATPAPVTSVEVNPVAPGLTATESDPIPQSVQPLAQPPAIQPDSVWTPGPPTGIDSPVVPAIADNPPEIASKTIPPASPEASPAATEHQKSVPIAGSDRLSRPPLAALQRQPLGHHQPLAPSPAQTRVQAEPTVYPSEVAPTDSFTPITESSGITPIARSEEASAADSEVGPTAQRSLTTGSPATESPPATVDGTTAFPSEVPAPSVPLPPSSHTPPATATSDQTWVQPEIDQPMVMQPDRLQSEPEPPNLPFPNVVQPSLPQTDPQPHVAVAPDLGLLGISAAAEPDQISAQPVPFLPARVQSDLSTDQSTEPGLIQPNLIQPDLSPASPSADRVEPAVPWLSSLQPEALQSEVGQPEVRRSAGLPAEQVQPDLPWPNVVQPALAQPYWQLDTIAEPGLDQPEVNLADSAGLDRVPPEQPPSASRLLKADLSPMQAAEPGLGQPNLESPNINIAEPDLTQPNLEVPSVNEPGLIQPEFNTNSPTAFESPQSPVSAPSFPGTSDAASVAPSFNEADLSPSDAPTSTSKESADLAIAAPNSLQTKPILTDSPLGNRPPLGQFSEQLANSLKPESTTPIAAKAKILKPSPDKTTSSKTEPWQAQFALETPQIQSKEPWQAQFALDAAIPTAQSLRSHLSPTVDRQPKVQKSVATPVPTIHRLVNPLADAKSEKPGEAAAVTDLQLEQLARICYSLARSRLNLNSENYFGKNPVLLPLD
jgi:hypothetical protein